MLRSRFASLTAVLGLLAAGGGYLAGHAGSANRAAAVRAGTLEGQRAGERAGLDRGYPAGMAAGERTGYRRAHARSYAVALRRAGTG